MYNNKNFRTMKFLEVVNNKKNAKGFVKVDMRGNRGYITVNVDGMGDVALAGEVFLYKNLNEKIRIGPIYLKKGNLTRNLVLNGREDPLELYNLCGIVANDEIIMCAFVFKDENKSAVEFIRKMQNVNKTKQFNQVTDGSQCGKKNCYIEKDDCNCNIQDIDSILEEDNKDNSDNTDNSDNKCDCVKEESKGTQASEKESTICNEKNNTNKKLYCLLEEFERVEPLEQKIDNLKWWKIQYDDGSIYKGFLPFFNQVISTYYPYPVFNHITTCQALMKSYGHYLFGIYEKDDQISHFVYGVPGKFIKEEQPYRGATGFKNWSYKTRSNPGDYGYWICFVNAKTGAVTDPPRM